MQVGLSYFVNFLIILNMLKIKTLQFNPISEEWTLVLSSEIAYTLCIEVPKKWASELIRSGKLIQTYEKDEWVTYKPIEA